MQRIGGGRLPSALLALGADGSLWACPVRCGMFRSTPGLPPPMPAVPPVPSHDTQKCLQTSPTVPQGVTSPLVLPTQCGQFLWVCPGIRYGTIQRPNHPFWKRRQSLCSLLILMAPSQGAVGGDLLGRRTGLRGVPLPLAHPGSSTLACEDPPAGHTALFTTKPFAFRWTELGNIPSNGKTMSAMVTFP